MTYPLNETFNDPQGRWDQYAPWDGTESSDSAKGFLTTQKHVDLRSFRVIPNFEPIPQTVLDALPQTTLDAEPQTSMEEVAGTNTVDEAWTADATAGLGTFSVGAMATRGGWPGLQAQTTGAAINATYRSSLSTAIDISGQNDLSLIFPDYNSFDTSSTIQLSSSPDGTFGTAADNSATVAFSSNTGAMPQLLLPLSDFTSGAGASFSLAKVTGVRVTLVKASAPASGLTVTMMAMRAVASAWVPSALDFDTRAGIICVPVTLNGNVYAGSVASGFQFVRGDGSKLDPIPSDLAMNMYFYPGGSTSPNDATGSNYNVIGFILREIKDTSAGTGSHIEVRLKFNATGSIFEAYRVDTTGGSPGSATIVSDYTSTVGIEFDPTQHYVLTVNLRGTRIDAAIYTTDINHNVILPVWQLPTTLTDTNYVYRNGRVGFIANLLTRDAYIDEIDVAPTGFAEMTTEVYESRTPVDGLQLAVVSASDKDLFTDVTASDLFIDQTKTLSGNGSYRTLVGMTTNSFIVDDWTNTYLNLAIWVPAGVTTKNQPQIVLNTSAGAEFVPMPTLQPAQWNTLHFDLGLFRNLLSATSYSLTIQPPASPDKPLGYFWVDDLMIGRRRVAWSARATANGPFRYFGDLVNNPNGAVHFIPEERGTELQIKAEALTEDGWVQSFNAFPRYAQLGLPVYDEAFETR